MGTRASPPKSEENILRSIADTALWVAYYRATETARRDAIFCDPHAKRLAGERGKQIVRRLRHGKGGAWAMIVRTALFDELILKVLEREGVDTVINLAAGLDARPYRLAVPDSLRWVEVDLPDVILYKQDILAQERPRCRLERVALDLSNVAARRALFARLNQMSSRALIVTEGLLAYLAPDNVAALAADLHAQPAFRFWLTEVASPLVLKRTRKHWGKELQAANACMQFAPENGAEFFRPCGWDEREFRDFFTEAQRLKREMPGAWLMHLWARVAPRRFRKMLAKWKSGAVLLSRN